MINPKLDSILEGKCSKGYDWSFAIWTVDEIMVQMFYING